MAQDATDFELSITQIYRELGAKVEHNKNIGGLQIDVFAVQYTQDGSLIRTAIECKFYNKPIGVNLAVEICQRFVSLKSAGLVEKGVVVASNGFTQDARTLCENHLVECFTPDDLQRRIADFTTYLKDLDGGQEVPYAYQEVIQRGAFISLPAHTEKGQPILAITDFIEDWINGPGQFLTILGEYGSGKTTTCWNVAQRIANFHLRTGKGRIPILIELKRFSQNFNLRTFMADLLLNQKGINIRSYSLFEKLNREGRFVIIFDGFDEMTTYADPAIVFRYLDEILSLQQGKAKVLLTCRSSFFKDQTDLERLQTGTDLHSLLHRHIGYQVVFLDGLTEEQLQHYLSCYYGEEWVDFFEELERRPDLRSLAERPILLNMIVNTIQSVKSLAAINVSQLYEQYTDIWIKRDNWRCHLTPNQRSDISKVLAFEMARQQSARIHHKDLQIRIADYFQGSVTPQVIDQYAHEVRTCSFLRNDMQGFYSFVHRSFAEFFVAKYILDQVTQGKSEQLGESLSLETLRFLGEFISNQRHEYLHYVWDMLRNPSEPDRKPLNERVRAVAAYLLLQCKENLSGTDLSHLIFPEGASLIGAQLSDANCAGLIGIRLCLDGADLTRANFENSILKECSFRRATIVQAEFGKADLSGSDFTTTDMRGANFIEANLDGIKITPSDVSDYIKKARLDKISIEQKRFGAITNFKTLVKEIPDKQKRNSVKVLLDTVFQADPQIARNQLQKSSIELQHELIICFADIEYIYQERIKKLQESIEKKKKDEEPQSIIIKDEQKKRKMRQKYRAIRLRQEYILRQLKALINAIQSPLGDGPDFDKKRGIHSQVSGANFAYSFGLTNQQAHWLEQNKAIIRDETPIIGLA